MAENMEDPTDEQSRMDFKSKLALFKSTAKTNQGLNTATNPGKGSQKLQPDSTACQPPPSRNQTGTTKRFLQESPKRSDRETLIDSRTRQPPEETIEEGAPTNQSRESLTDMEIFKHPMCLISAKSVHNEEGEEISIVLQKEENTFDQIKRIDMPLVVIAVVGLYRTGKSYLMNRLADASKGFALGDTIESKTKGIWAWCKLHPKRKNTVLLLLDTEGLGDVDKGDKNHDNKIFTLATLLCNCLVYNMKGAFDNDAVAKLTFVTEMAKNIRYRGKSSEDNQTLNLILPDFVLCLRDFSLKLMKGDRKLSENEYLEESLAEKKSKAEHFNKPRECIRKFFAKRKCFAFPVPGDGDVLENLETLNFNDLSVKFQDVTIKFVLYIYSKPPKELLASKPVNGQMFATLADRYVTAIINGAVPDVDDAFKAVANEENAKIEKEAIEMFEKEMKRVIPVPGKILVRHFSKAQQGALDHLRKHVVMDKLANCEKQAQMKMDSIMSNIKEDNDLKVRDICESKLQEAYEKNLKGRITNREYDRAGGFKMFQRDLEGLRKDYTSALRDFEENETLWNWHGFVQKMEETERKIVEADENMTQREKEEEQKRNQENIEKLLREQQKAQQEAMEKQKHDLEIHYKKLEEDRIKQEKIDGEKYKALVKERLDKEVAEKELARRLKEDEERSNQWITTRIWNALWNQ